VLRALVLTAGFGTRLDPLTRLVAKPAVPLGSRTLIEHVLSWLRREGVEDVVLNLHFRPETITAVVGDGRHLGLRVRYSWERPILGSAGGPRRALPLLDAPTFLIVNGDTLCDVALGPMIAAHARTRADVTMAVVKNPSPDHYNGIVSDGDGRVRTFVPKGQAAGSWHFVGIQVVNASVFAPLTDGVVAETVAGLYRDMVAHGSGRIHVWPVTSTFLDVGTPRDYLNAVRQIDPAPTPSGSVVWPEARVGPGAELTDCIVAGAVNVPAGFRARDRLLIPGALARPDDSVEIKGDIAIFPL
jgi:NDP-sugar pyrophosphorylase family protein